MHGVRTADKSTAENPRLLRNDVRNAGYRLGEKHGLHNTISIESVTFARTTNEAERKLTEAAIAEQKGIVEMKTDPSIMTNA